jgi:hypothetical protein
MFPTTGLKRYEERLIRAKATMRIYQIGKLNWVFKGFFSCCFITLTHTVYYSSPLTSQEFIIHNSIVLEHIKFLVAS